MKTYSITLSNLAATSVRSSSASDAIQSALMKNPGNTVVACNCPGMSYDVPPHKALTPEDVERLAPKREPREQKQYCSTPERHAPWIEEWASARKLEI